jgi:hypothetical protein
LRIERQSLFQSAIRNPHSAIKVGLFLVFQRESQNGLYDAV